MKERDIIINIDSTIEETNRDISDELADADNSVNLSRIAKNVGAVSPELGEKNKKEKRMSVSAKKPPRPPRGLSLDAADQKLIKEISELLMIKRARIERMKALKKSKAAKASSASTSSSGNLIAMFFTVLFCVVIIFQGIWPKNTPAIGIPTLPKTLIATGDNVVAAHILSEVGSPNLAEPAPGLDNLPEDGKATD